MKINLQSGVLEIVLDDLGTNNALSLPKAKQLSQSLSSARLQLIYITNLGRVFCAGGNLKDYADQKNKGAGLAINREIQSVLQQISQYPALKVAFVNGDCLGGGVEFLSCFDLIWSAPHVYIGLWQRKMGLSFGWGGFERLAKRVNPAWATHRLLTGELQTAGQARDAGLVDEILDEAEARTRWEILKASALNDKDGSFAAVSRDLPHGETSVFEKLWWSEYHRSQLQKFSKK